MKKNLHIDKKQEPNLADNLADNLTAEAGTLSWKTRVWCYAGCLFLGVLLSVLGSICLFLPIHGHLIPFAVFYTLGTLTSLASTCFLEGPVKQITEMFASKRWIATVVVLVGLVFTLMAAVWWKKPVLVLLFCVIQSLAMTWYSLSYVPYARTVVRNIFASTVSE